MGGEFVYDDTVQILENPWIKAESFKEIFTNDVWGFTSMDTTKYYRPMMYVVYILVHSVFGMSPFGFHLANVLFHACVSIAVFFLIERLLIDTEKKTLGAFFGALVFAVHPIHTEAVAWVGCLPETAFSVFALLAIICYIDKRIMLSAAFFGVALFFKETAIVTVALIAAYDVIFKRINRVPDNRIWIYLSFIMTAGLYLIIRAYAIGGVVVVSGRHEELSTAQYLLNVFPLFMDYLSLLLFPFKLNVFHVFRPVFGLTEPKAIAGVAVVTAFAVTAYAIRKRPAALFGMAFILIPLLPVFYIPALGENTMAERYLYLPSVGLSIIIGYVIVSIDSGIWRKTALILLGAVASIYILMTVSRNTVWKNDVVLWEDSVSKSTDGSIPHSELGYAYHMAGDLDKAVDEYNRALSLNRQHFIAQNDLGNVYMKLGRLDDAIRHYRFAVELKPEVPEFYKNLAAAYRAKGWETTAQALEEQAVALINGTNESK